MIRLSLITIICIGCSEPNNIIPTLDASNEGNYISDASINYSNENDNDVYSTPIYVGYTPCAVRFVRPTQYKRLNAHYCTDSNNISYIDFYTDNILKIECIWGQGSDLIIRCLPDFYQSSPMYTDDSCTTPIIALINVSFTPKYMCVGSFSDAGIWSDVFALTEDFSPPPPYFLIYTSGTDSSDQFECSPFHFPVSNTRFIKLGDLISPTIFQAR